MFLFVFILSVKQLQYICINQCLMFSSFSRMYDSFSVICLSQATLNDRSSIQKPHLFFLPDVPSIPFFPRDAHRHDIEVLEANYPIILAEFQAVYQRGIDPKMGWTGLGPKVQLPVPVQHLLINCSFLISLIYSLI